MAEMLLVLLPGRALCRAASEGELVCLLNVAAKLGLIHCLLDLMYEMISLHIFALKDRSCNYRFLLSLDRGLGSVTSKD